MNILVTGANGQLGKTFRQLSSGQTKHDFSFANRNELDITQFEHWQRVLGEKSFEFVINCAAYTQVDAAEDHAVDAFSVNADAVGHLLAAVKGSKTRIIQISTDYVFDGSQQVAYNEEAATSPRSVYGKSKLMGEKTLLKNTNRHYVVRTSWLYSPYGKNFVNTILRLASEKNEIQVVEDQKGSPTFAEDLAKALINLVEVEADNTGKENRGIYHYANDGFVSWFELAKEIVKISGLSCEVLPTSTEAFGAKAPRPHFSKLDTSKMRKTFHVETPDWKDALKRCLEQRKRIAN